MDTEALEAARLVAFRYFGYAARSRAEIERRLTRAEFAPEIIAAVIAEMEGHGWLDDSTFAKSWVEDRADRKRYGKQRLAAELRNKGVARDMVDAALENVSDESETARALAAAQSRWPADKLRGADRETIASEKRKLANFLQRRGFGWPIITQVFATLLSNEE